MKIRPLTETERQYTYTQSMQIQGQTGCIGHLRGDFDKSGNGSAMIYHSEYGGDSVVSLDVRQYADNGRIALQLITDEEGEPEPFGSLTVNIDAPAPHYCGYLDINNLSNAEKFVTEHGLGEFTGITGRSGFCEYPLYLFDADRLRELCPEQMAVYEHNIGMDAKKPEKDKKR